MERIAALNESRAAEVSPRGRTRYANETELARLFGMERYYRPASAHAHGLEYPMGMADIDWLDDASNPGTEVGMASANSDHVADIAEVAVDFVEAAVAELESYAATAS